MSMESDVYQYVVAGDTAGVTAQVQKALDAGMNAETILKQGLIAAMDEVGRLFEQGEKYVPEMLVSARAMQAGLALLKPHLQEMGVEAAGKVVVGTVKGDLHDIGKNLVAMMLEGAGFEIIDLGTDVKPEAFVAAAKEHNAKIIGLSALLTTTMVNMQATIKALQDERMREDVFVMIGGAPITPDYAVQIGADAHGADASRAVALAKQALN